MNAPNTIYIDPMWCEKTWSKHLHNDTDIAYIRGDVSYELAKTVEAQKAEMARLRKSLDTYGRHNRACVMLDPYDPSTDCTCGFTAALRGGSMSEQDITNLLTGLRYDTCDKHDSCEPCKGLRQDSIAAIESLQQTVAELQSDIDRHMAIASQLATEVEELRAERERMQAALKRIAKWQEEFPSTGEHWPDGSPISYVAQYGSNGERDYMRAVAVTALASPPAAEEPKS